MTEQELSGDADERYGTFETVDGDLVIYDRDEPKAWIQSTYAVEVGPRSAETAE